MSRKPKFAAFWMTMALAVVLAGCAPTEGEKTEAAVLEGRFDAAVEAGALWVEQSPEECMPHFLLALGHYILGNGTEAANHREAWLGADDAVPAASRWLEANREAMEIEWLAPFLEAVLTEAEGYEVEAENLYAVALEKYPDNEFLEHSLYSMAGDDQFEIRIPEEDPVTYTGTLWLDNQRFLPVDPLVEPDNADFKVTGGKLVSRLADLEWTARFGDWAYVLDGATGAQVGWASMLTAGKIVTRPEPGDLAVDLENATSLKIDCRYEVRPFDFLGKYVLIDLDAAEGLSFPLVKSYTEDDIFFLLGARLVIDPDLFRDAAGYFGGRNLRMAVEDASFKGPVTPYHEF